MLVAPLVTAAARSWGTRPPMLVGVVALTGGFVSASFASSAWHLLLSQGVMTGIGLGFIYIPSIAVLSQWFSKKRSLANGITAAGSGVGGMLFSLVTDITIRRLSLAWSLRITAAMACVMNTLATILLRDRNHIINTIQHPFKTDLLRRQEVWLLLSWIFISMLGYVTLYYSLPDFAISIGLSQSQSSNTIIIVNLGTAVGRPWIGYLSDRFGREKVAAILTLSCGVLCLAIWLPAESYGLTLFFALVSGAILGVFWAASARSVCC